MIKLNRHSLRTYINAKPTVGTLQKMGHKLGFEITGKYGVHLVRTIDMEDDPIVSQVRKTDALNDIERDHSLQRHCQNFSI